MINLYALKDKASNTTNNPIAIATNRDAIESLKGVANDPQTNISKYPKDFELYHLGSYNPRTMAFDLNDNPKFLISADQLIDEK
jgi:hypothetical protein